ncbi:MAG: ABC transporter ATP-binding protein [Zoogloeaceae bacterium]|jgi:putative ABC transport system ATP-binding protein|nr:ABC transporter ATP-binding protein [Zoogloeaceae bacterium]
MTEIVRLEGLSKTYGMGGANVTALADINLVITGGEFVALIGPSGSGKSTLLNMIGGIDKPSGGAVYIDGQRIDTLNEQHLLKLRREKIAYVFQEARLLPSLTALENVTLSSAFNRKLNKNCNERAMELLGKVGLAGRAKHMPHQLSGGEAQRVCIARALFNQPRLILADEPTGNLDHRTRIGIVELFEELHGEGNAVIMVTHDPELAMRAGRTISLHDGTLQTDEVRAAQVG